MYLKVAIYNDTYVKERVQFGPELVMETLRDQLYRVGIELLGTVQYTKRDRPKFFRQADLIIVNGEGSFHHNRRNDIVEISKAYPSILINTVFQQNSCDTSSFLFKSARESKSAEALGCGVMPDLIFTNKRLQNLKLNDNAKGCAIVNHFDHVKTMQPAAGFLDEVVKYNSMDSESFHGLIVGLMLGMQITKVRPGNTWKNESLMEDSLAENYIESAKAQINNFFEDTIWSI